MLSIEKYKEEIIENIDKYDEDIYSAIKRITKKLNIQLDGDDVYGIYMQTIDWLCSEYKEPILTDKEKEYLSAVIKPFRDRVITVIKRSAFLAEGEYIAIWYTELAGTKVYMHLPYFRVGTMYKGMKKDKDYTLEELGL